MNTPAEFSDGELKRLACLETWNGAVAVVTFVADDGRGYTFATAQFLDGLHECRSASEPNAPCERLVLRFTTGDAVVLGSRLDRIEEGMAAGCLRRAKTIHPRHASAVKSGPVILSIIVNRKDEP
jgi:hypothetical protein